MRPFRSFIKRRIALTATATEIFRSLPIQEKYCKNWSRPASATTPWAKGYSPRNSAAFDQHDQQSACCSSCINFKNSGKLEKPLCTCDPLISKTQMTPSTESSCGRRSRASAHQTFFLTFIRQFHEGMQPRVRTDDGE